jgi:phage-related protein
MPCSIEYFNERVLAEIEGWPASLLHAFTKKTRATPERHLRLARRRMREARDG